MVANEAKMAELYRGHQLRPQLFGGEKIGGHFPGQPRRHTKSRIRSLGTTQRNGIGLQAPLETEELSKF